MQGVAVPGMNRDTTRAHLIHPFRHNQRSTSLDFQTNAGAHKHSPCRQRLLWRSSSSLPFLSPPFGRDSRGAIAIFLWLLVPVIFAACCASNWSQIWDFSVFLGGQNWQFFCLRLFLLLVCLFVCLSEFEESHFVFCFNRVAFFLSFVIFFSNSQRFL